MIEHLVNTYFAREQPWLHVLDETHSRDSRRRDGRYSSSLLINSTLALASRYLIRMEVHSGPNNPYSACRAFLQSAKTSLQIGLKWLRTTTVQTIELMSIFYVTIGSNAAGRLLSLHMGLNMDMVAVRTAAEAQE